jgi:DNA polymerase IIIc chi subunit
MSTPKILFISVKSLPMKLQTLTGVASHCFASKARLLFSVTSEEAACYLDELLWKLPPESFLPHEILTKPSNELIAITTGLNNFNQASILFNLRPDPHPLATSFPFIYELLDETQPGKLAQSEARKQAYLEQGFQVNIR